MYEATEDGTSEVMFVQRGGFALHLDAPMSGHGRHVVVTLEVEDTDAMYDQWRGRVELSRPPRNEEWKQGCFAAEYLARPYLCRRAR
ncbi:MAG TPA: hypothetical protein VMM78_12970 [Thermomicrobiales bacterium]|nr:hypothetical protein [Thermomicrobiales bacterium]